ncbi:UDP-2,3-diacylglucosamine hydrolase [Taibaiella sp. KBW10]|uniref:UDP-2,3-diacylglucosamine diphosphatase n=1 Tax=Taibaiella sp. KBW10 TaxID=2153357 RepID=UPI000F5ADF1E|nr:UDP-2,3-diacylglucosamine diphosphatase [Taibaiella sp. KBW10]RQO31802.1 UDP-2,3-diacylglucosamine hydrolase [Taibaiella sp. KBW10]
MQLPQGKKIFFASDFHLGIPDKASSLLREKRICKWLDSIRDEAAKIYLVGDLFDVWFEYKNVVPKGYTRFLGKLAELADAGIPIEIFTGNHDLWMHNYFPEELNIPVHFDSITFEVNGKKFFVAHGDGLGPGDKKYKMLKSLMNSPLSQWLYRRIHPDTGVGIANYFSRRGAKHQGTQDGAFKGEDREWLILFAKAYLQKEHIDYFVFGHRHLALTLPIKDSLYVNLGDWISYNTYGVFDGNNFSLKTFEAHA